MSTRRGTGTDPLPSYDPTELYWRDIKDAEPLDHERETEMFTRARQGDLAAQQGLVVANLRFVVSVARDYKHYGLSFMELISEGNMGLLEAIRRFDETRGFRFITYAVWWIRQAILKALAQQGRIARPPMSQVNDRQKMEKEANQLAHELGRAPTFDEISEAVKLSQERTLNALEVAQPDISLDAVYTDEDEPLHTVFPDEQPGIDERFEQEQLSETLQGCLGVLCEREYQIVQQHFGLDGGPPQTLEEIGAEMGITRERVRQVRNRALAKVRAHCGSVLLEFARDGGSLYSPRRAGREVEGDS
ncbi:MAG: RNA polymerase sigma factor RpoD/SigA [Candidatus Latescibacterota bacterium]